MALKAVGQGCAGNSAFRPCLGRLCALSSKNDLSRYRKCSRIQSTFGHLGREWAFVFTILNGTRNVGF